MSEPKAMSDAQRGGEPLTLTLTPALSEFLRKEAARRSLGPDELAQRLLMRGIHQQRLDDVIAELCPAAGAGAPSSEVMLAARLEAGAMLGAFCEPLGRPGRAGPSGTSGSLARELLDRFRSA